VIDSHANSAPVLAEPPESGRENGDSFERRLNPGAVLAEPPESGRENGDSFERRLD